MQGKRCYGVKIPPTIRKTIIARDGGKCTKCGSTIKLNVHHIVPVKDSVALRYAPKNLTTLCIQCHFKAHGKEKLAHRITRLHFFEADEYDVFEKYCKGNNLNESAVIRELIREYLGEIFGAERRQRSQPRR